MNEPLVNVVLDIRELAHDMVDRELWNSFGHDDFVKACLLKIIQKCQAAYDALQ